MHYNCLKYLWMWGMHIMGYYIQYFSYIALNLVTGSPFTIHTDYRSSDKSNMKFVVTFPSLPFSHSLSNAGDCIQFGKYTKFCSLMPAATGHSSIMRGTLHGAAKGQQCAIYYADWKKNYRINDCVETCWWWKNKTDRNKASLYPLKFSPGQP